MDTKLVFGLGMLGALAPEIVRLYELRMQSAALQWSWFYIVISLLFAALGGVLAVTLPATNYWSALYVGISTPVLVNQILKKTTGKPDRQMKSGANADARQRERPSLAAFIKAL